MILKGIYLNEEMSIRAYNTCVDNEISTIQELKQYYVNYSSFRHLRNCGEKTNLELISLCLKYFDIDTNEKIEILNENEFSFPKAINSLDIDKRKIINEFIKINFLDLSIRTKNGIRGYLKGEINLNGFSKHIFSKPYFQLSHIKNLGSKSIPELENFIKELKEYIFKIYNLKEGDEFLLTQSIPVQIKIENSLNNLNRLQRNIINNFISTITQQLSVRSKNAINKHLDKKLNINSFLDNIFSDINFNVSDIKNVGQGSMVELSMYLDKIKQFLNEVGDIKEEEELLKLENKFFVKSIFKDVLLPDNIFDSFTIFKLLDYIIENNILFDINQTFIFQNTYNLYSDVTFSKLDDVAIEVGLSKERVRQIRKDLINEMLFKLKFIKNFDLKILSNYGVDFNQNLIVVSNEKANQINLNEGTKFSNHFILFTFSFLLNDNFYLIGNLEDVLILKESNARKRHNWQNLYLVSKLFVEEFDFYKFIEDIEIRTNERNQEDYKFNFKSYLSRFLLSNDINILEDLFSVCEKMINEEFNIYLNIDEDIIFERKTHKTLREYAYEALEIIGKPSHIDQINEQIKILKPDYENDITNTSLKREYGFVPFGRKSVFGLKKWDSEEGKVKGGTIRSIAEEFLTNYPQPMNIKDIANYVLQFRPESNEKSIIYNLKMEDNNRFTFFKNSFIGLKSKQYNDNKYSLLDSNEKMIIRSWEENYQELLNFISINNKLPSSMTCPLEEKRISRWLYTQKSKINRGLLDNSRAQLIIEITSNFNLRDNKTTLFRSDGYKKLIEFIEQEKRLPSANKNAESQLYAFFYKQRKLYEDSKLNADELSKFIQIAKLIQNIKK